MELNVEDEERRKGIGVWEGHRLMGTHADPFVAASGRGLGSGSKVFDQCRWSGWTWK